MEKQEKEFILNKGLILGLVLLLFPITDLLYGLNMSTNSFFFIFVLLWIVVYTYFIIKWSKEFASYYEVFSFKDSFRILYIISALGFVVLTVGKIALWNVYSPDTYIEINHKRSQSSYDDALVELKIDNDSIVYNTDSLKNNMSQLSENIKLNNKLNFVNTFLKPTVDYWNDIKETGISKFHFIDILFSVLFINSIYCAILALFVRKKENFIKTN